MIAKSIPGCSGWLMDATAAAGFSVFRAVQYRWIAPRLHLPMYPSGVWGMSQVVAVLPQGKIGWTGDD